MGRVELNGEEILNTLEPLRKKWNLTKWIEQLVLCILVLCLMSPMAEVMFMQHIQGIYIGILPAMSIIFIVCLYLEYILRKNCRKAKQEYEETYKRLISKPVLDSIFENAIFLPDTGYSRVDFKASELMWGFGAGHTYDSEDLIMGTCNGVAFRRADVRVTHRSDKRTVVDVDGRLLEVAFPKKINGIVRVVKEGTVINLMGVNSLLVETEDADFNKKFNVYAKDKHSAFYLLTPHFMEYIKKLYNRDERIAITFDGEKLYFLQSGHGGIFEPPAGAFNAWDEVRKCRQELSEIGEIIDILQVDDVVERERKKREATGAVSEKAEAIEPPQIILGIEEKKIGLIVAIVLLLTFLYFAQYL
ncbi:MAG: DUF3137 domain-containing protein [Lachnospiraceae bacterium]|nr:DUF3137 domain-containing protein [Lachnospiraceae bacterium]